MNAKPSTSVRVTRRFEASPERVFDAWLDPKKAAKWLFATPTGQMVRAEVDARVGGTYHFVDRRDGEDIDHTGQYLELDRPRRLVFTLAVPKFSKDSSRVTIDITPLGTGCELTLTHEQIAPEFLSGAESGWTKILDGLAASLKKDGGPGATSRPR